MENQKTKISKSALKLSLLCALVYFTAYLGRLSYSANIVMVIEAFQIDKATAGIVGTCLFISYGVGQVVNGLLCKFYNPKYSITISLVLSACCNIAVSLVKVNFVYIYVYWFINGYAQSILYSSIIRLLNRNIASVYIRKAIVVMSFPVSVGTFSIYGISALFRAINISYNAVFVVASVLMIVVAIVWFAIVDRLKEKCKVERDEIDGDVIKKDLEQRKQKNGLPKAFVGIFIMLACFAVVNNFVKDGVITWMPTILKEKYALDDALSTFLTLFLPLFAIFGSITAINLSKRIKSYVLICGIFYLIASLFIGLVILFLDLPVWIITLVCFIIVATSMSAVNNVITGIFPMTYSQTMNAGTIAGLLDGFCYVGSAITTYGLGSISDSIGGWDGIFYLLMGLCVLMVVICSVYSLILKKK